MDYSAGAAIGAGVLAAAIMGVMLYMGIAIAPRQMTMNLFYMLGTMVTRNVVLAYMAGAMAHIVMGLVFALIHTGIYQATDIESNLAAWGLLFGFVHWLVVGVGMGMIGAMHPLMRRGELAAPVVFVRNYPTMTVMGFLMLHLVYGLLVGVFYEAWA